MRINNLSDYQRAYQSSLQQPEIFWDQVAREFEWQKSWTHIVQGTMAQGNIRWFDGATTNITVNALDRHVRTQPDKIAYYFEPNRPDAASVKKTYRELLEDVCRFANVLIDQGVGKGDVVCFYLPMIPELLVGVLACARLGVIHNVVFGGFSAAALASRIQDSQAQLLVTCDHAERGDKAIPIKATANEAAHQCPTLKKVLVLERGGSGERRDKDVALNPLLAQAAPVCEPVMMNAEDPLFILYTSGSTGKPKGILHTTGGYMVWAGYTFQNVFQLNAQDLFWCTADIGWITGHSYIAYGPLLNGASQVIFEGVPSWPDAGRFWQVIDKYKVTHFYTAPTAIRALQAMDLSYVKKQNLSSLKVLGSVGEPINEEAWQWYHEHIGRGRCPIVDTWWQTETGGIMISSLAGITPEIPTFATQPLPGVAPALLDSQGHKISTSTAEGVLCIERPWPGMARTIFGDHDRYLKTYFTAYPGYYFTGDGARRDDNGNYRIIGRVDDVVNVSGHRIGTAEVENAINLHKRIVESAVVGTPHPVKGEGIVAFVTGAGLKKADRDVLLKEVNALVSKEIGAFSKLENLFVVSGLPKTRSGKIMRRILRKAATGDRNELGDVSTLVNPEVVDELFNQ